jgi:hypothetical protein
MLERRNGWAVGCLGDLAAEPNLVLVPVGSVGRESRENVDRADYWETICELCASMRTPVRVRTE